MRVEILPIFTNLNQEIPNISTRKTYPVYMWLDLDKSEVWAEADVEELADKIPNIYTWEIPLVSDRDTNNLMSALRSEFVRMIENHIKDSPLPPYSKENPCQWKLNAEGMEAKHMIDRYLKVFCGFMEVN